MSEDTRYQDYVDAVEGHLRLLPEQVKGDHVMYAPSTNHGSFNIQPKLDSGPWMIDCIDVFPSPLNDAAYYSALAESLSTWDPSSLSQDTYWGWKDSLDGRSVVNDAVPAPEEDCTMEESPIFVWPASPEHPQESPIFVWPASPEHPHPSSSRSTSLDGPSPQPSYSTMSNPCSPPPHPFFPSIPSLPPPSSLPSPVYTMPEALAQPASAAPVHAAPEALARQPASTSRRFRSSHIGSTLKDLGLLVGPSPPTRPIQPQTFKDQRRQEYRRKIAEGRDVTLAGSAGLWYSIRLPEACKYCRTRKVKCNGLRPSCELCFVTETKCEYHTPHHEQDLKLDTVLQKIREEKTDDQSADNESDESDHSSPLPIPLVHHRTRKECEQAEGEYKRFLSECPEVELPLYGPHGLNNRLSAACNRCRRRKIRCNGLKPSCKTCYETKSTCAYAKPRDCFIIPPEQQQKTEPDMEMDELDLNQTASAGDATASCRNSMSIRGMTASVDSVVRGSSSTVLANYAANPNRCGEILASSENESRPQADRTVIRWATTVTPDTAPGQ